TEVASKSGKVLPALFPQPLIDPARSTRRSNAWLQTPRLYFGPLRLDGFSAAIASRFHCTKSPAFELAYLVSKTVIKGAVDVRLKTLRNVNISVTRNPLPKLDGEPTPSPGQPLFGNGQDTCAHKSAAGLVRVFSNQPKQAMFFVRYPCREKDSARLREKIPQTI